VRSSQCAVTSSGDSSCCITPNMELAPPSSYCLTFLATPSCTGVNVP
jgi:hypothetical protein